MLKYINQLSKIIKYLIVAILMRKLYDLSDDKQSLANFQICTKFVGQFYK